MIFEKQNARLKPVTESTLNDLETEISILKTHKRDFPPPKDLVQALEFRSMWILLA